MSCVAASLLRCSCSALKGEYKSARQGSRALSTPAHAHSTSLVALACPHSVLRLSTSLTAACTSSRASSRPRRPGSRQPRGRARSSRWRGRRSGGASRRWSAGSRWGDGRGSGTQVVRGQGLARHRCHSFLISLPLIPSRLRLQDRFGKLEAEAKGQKKLLVREVKSLRAQVAALCEDRDAYKRQANALLSRSSKT